MRVRELRVVRRLCRAGRPAPFTFREIFFFLFFGAVVSTSRAMSIARMECVMAPAETKSTPASAALRAVSGVMRPDASVVTREPVASL